MPSNYTPKIGDIVKVNVWHGRVTDYFMSITTQEIVVKILFAKNVFKGQPEELHGLAGLDIQPASLEDLLREVETLARAQEVRLKELDV